MAKEEYHVYFASCTKNGGIYHYRVQENGGFTFVSKTDCDSPMYLIIHEKQLDVLLRAPFPGKEESGFQSFQIGENGDLCRSSELHSTEGRCACHLTWFRGKLYVVNYLSGSIFSSDGTLCVHSGSSIHPKRQEDAHTHCVIPAPDQSCLMVTDLGMDKIFLYEENLKRRSEFQVQPGSGPRHLVCMDRNHVASINELGCTVSIYRYENRRLNHLETLSLLEREPRITDLGAAIRYRNGHLYASTRGADVITTFSWDGRSLKRQSVVECGGESPRDFFLLKDWLICMNENSSAVTLLPLGEDGLPEGKAKQVLLIDHVLCGACFSENEK